MAATVSPEATQYIRRRGLAASAFISLLLLASLAILLWGRQFASPSALVASNLSLAYQVISTLGYVPTLLVGTLILAKQPQNRYGWVWIALAFSFAMLSFATSYGTVGLILTPGSLPFPWVILYLGGLSWLLLVCITPFVLLLFPTGRLPGPRWKILTWIIGTVLAVSILLGWGMPGQSGLVPLENPNAFTGRLAEVTEFAIFAAALIGFASILAGVASVILRYRRAAGLERQQIKWFAFGAAWLGLWIIFDGPTELPGNWEAVKEAVGFNALPIAVGIAILRYRLYDIDVIIRRTLIYGVLTGALALVYFGSVAGLQALLGRTAGDRSSLAVVISTLAMAALFTPLRQGVQRFIDRRFYRRRYDVEKTLEQFSSAVRDEVALEALIGNLVRVVGDTMQPRHMSLWLADRTSRRPE